MTTTFITTFRNSEPQRLANLTMVLRWLEQFELDQVVVIEQDLEPSLKSNALPGSPEHVFCYNSGPFNKAWGMNVGARQATGEVLIIGDADMIIAPRVLRMAIVACQQTYDAVNPYRRMRDLTQTETRAIQTEATTLAELPTSFKEASHQNRAKIGEFVCFCGGIFLIKRTVFHAVAGMDERFIGWGGEDDAMSYKLLRLCPNAAELDRATAFHLWHPRNTAEQRYGHAHYQNNLSLVREYQNANPEQLRNWADSAQTEYGRVDRYTTSEKP